MSSLLWLVIALGTLGVWSLARYALMRLGIDVLIWILIVYHLQEIGLGGRMRNVTRGFLQFQHRGHVGSFPRDANRGLLVSVVIRM